MALAAMAAAGLVSAVLPDMEAHFPTSVTPNGGPFVGSGMAERVAHHHPTFLQYCSTEGRAGEYSH